MESLQFNDKSNTFIYVDKKILSKNSKSKEGQDKMNNIEELKSSFYVFNSNKDYKIIIRMPTIEYSMPSSNFLFIKYLS